MCICVFVLVCNKEYQRKRESMTHVYFTINAYFPRGKSGKCVDLFVNASGKSSSQQLRAFSPSSACLVKHCVSVTVCVWASLGSLNQIRIGTKQVKVTGFSSGFIWSNFFYYNSSLTKYINISCNYTTLWKLLLDVGFFMLALCNQCCASCWKIVSSYSY